MKKSIYFLSSVCLAVFLFSCTANPKWIRKLPQPPKGTNYDYQRGEGIAETRDKARKKAEEDALDKTFINGMNIRKTSGVNHKFICNYIVEENSFKYKAYVLLKYSTASYFSGAKDDFKEGEGCESNEIISEKEDVNRAAMGKKIGELSQKTTSFGTLAQKFELANNPKEKNEIWHESNELYKEINRLQAELQALNAGTNVDSTVNVFGKMHNSCLEYRKNTKIYWQPELENEYSELALSKLELSNIIKSDCIDDKGILLAYKDKEPECSYRHVWTCYYKISLSIVLCKDGTTTPLKDQLVEGKHLNDEGYAYKNLQEKIKRADFWETWKQKIKKWDIQCE